MILSELSPRSRDTLRAIRNLPLPIGYYTDLSGSYVSERNTIRTNKQLKAFTKRWGAVWKIPWFKYWRQQEYERRIISGRYNAKKILRCINKNSIGGHGCCHIKSNKHCISADILAPAFLIKLLEIRTMFGVPDGICLLQVTRSLHEDLSDKDPDDIFGYINHGKLCQKLL